MYLNIPYMDPMGVFKFSRCWKFQRSEVTTITSTVLPVPTTSSNSTANRWLGHGNLNQFRLVVFLCLSYPRESKNLEDYTLED